ncbi:hypothetical protein NQZ68_022066, partial [Dissostichus eleginoides]
MDENLFSTFTSSLILRAFRWPRSLSFLSSLARKKKNVDKERRKLHKGQKTELGNKLRPWRCSLYATDEIGCAGEECFLSKSIRRRYKYLKRIPEFT